MQQVRLMATWMMLATAQGCVMSKIEEPKYEVVRDYGEFELRRYQSTIVAETVVDGEFSSSSNIGFRRLANYIFGDNKSKVTMDMTRPVTAAAESLPSEKISMTAPVSQVASGHGRWIISFTMPSAYTMATLPEPLDPAVQLREVPGATYAALRFSGFNSATLVEEKTACLRSLAAKENVRLQDRVIYARYNPPWKPWFLRRNEILIETQ